MAALHTVATSATAPLVSGRWWVGLRCAIASRKSIPADVKDQLSTLSNKFDMSIPYSPDGFKREMQFLEIVGGDV